jgi:hypothetical protein
VAALIDQRPARICFACKVARVPAEDGYAKVCGDCRALYCALCDLYGGRHRRAPIMARVRAAVAARGLR